MSAVSEEQALGAAASTPEPTSNDELEGFLRDLQRLEEVAHHWEETQVRTLTAIRETVEGLHREAIRTLIRAVKDVPEARPALRKAVSYPLVRSVLDYHGLLKPPAPTLEDRVRAALETVRPQIQSHGGDVEFVGLRPPGTVEVRLTGNCKGCPASAVTLHHGVEEAVVAAVPEIERVIQVKGPSSSSNDLVQLRVSPFASLEGRGFVETLSVSDLAANQVKVAEVDGVSVLLTLASGQVKAYRNAETEEQHDLLSVAICAEQCD
ncbi:MAG: NifU family protein, partial [Myxococcota bacterium]